MLFVSYSKKNGQCIKKKVDMNSNPVYLLPYF